MWPYKGSVHQGRVQGLRPDALSHYKHSKTSRQPAGGPAEAAQAEGQKALRTRTLVNRSKRGTRKHFFLGDLMSITIKS